MKENHNIKEIAGRYPRYIYWSDEDNCYIGSLPDICGNCCHADSHDEVYHQLSEIAESWVEDLLNRGESLPEIRSQVVRMGNGKDWKRTGRLVSLREQSGLSQLAFAATIGVSVNTYRKWEQGIRTPSGSGAVLLNLIEKDPSMIKKLQAAS